MTIPDYPASETATADTEYDAWLDSLYEAGPDPDDDNGVCQRCGRAMLSDDPVYWTPLVAGQQDAMCERCWVADDGEAKAHAAWLRLGGWQPSAPMTADEWAERQDGLAVDVDDGVAARGRARR